MGNSCLSRGSSAGSLSEPLIHGSEGQPPVARESVVAEVIRVANPVLYEEIDSNGSTAPTQAGERLGGDYDDCDRKLRDDIQEALSCSFEAEGEGEGEGSSLTTSLHAAGAGASADGKESPVPVAKVATSVASTAPAAHNDPSGDPTVAPVKIAAAAAKEAIAVDADADAEGNTVVDTEAADLVAAEGEEEEELPVRHDLFPNGDSYDGQYVHIYVHTMCGVCGVCLCVPVTLPLPHSLTHRPPYLHLHTLTGT